MSALSDFLTQGSAPWWSTLAGGLGGAAIALLSTKLSDKRKLNREDRRQWDKEITTLAATAVDECEKLLTFRGHEDVDHNGEPEYRYTGQHKYYEVIETLKRTRRNLVLYTRRDVVPKFDKLQKAGQTVADIDELPYDDAPPPTPEEQAKLDKLLEVFETAQVQFLEAIRKELRLT